MHWLATRIERIEQLQVRHAQLKQRREAGEGVRQEENACRMDFLASVTELVAEAGRRPGVLATFAAHEGLLIATSGDTRYCEAVAALAQTALLPAIEGAERMQLGPLQQLVLVGAQGKLALIRVGDIALGLLASEEVSLAASLA